jgi:hypothetical protein
MNKKRIGIGLIALLMLVISGSVVNAWPWSNNNDNHNNINFDKANLSGYFRTDSFLFRQGY